MYKQSMTQSDAVITIEVVRLLEGYKVKSTIVTGSRTMSLQSPDTWAKEETATSRAIEWVRYQQQVRRLGDTEEGSVQF